MRGSPAPKRPASPRSRLGLDGLLVPLPVLAVGRIGDQVVEARGRRARRCESVLPKAMFSASRPSALFMIEVGLADGEGLRVDLLPEEVDLAPCGIDLAAMCSLAMVSIPPEPQQGS